MQNILWFYMNYLQNDNISSVLVWYSILLMFTLGLFLLHLFIEVCVCVCVCATSCRWRGMNLTLHLVGSRDWTRVLGINSKPLYPLSHITSSEFLLSYGATRRFKIRGKGWPQWYRPRVPHSRGWERAQTQGQHRLHSLNEYQGTERVAPLVVFAWSSGSHS